MWQGYAQQLLTNAATDNVEVRIPNGGVYNFAAKATWGGGNVKLQQLMPDGSTYADVASSTISADGSLNLTLAPGLYRQVVTTATAIYSRITRVS